MLIHIVIELLSSLQHTLIKLTWDQTIDFIVQHDQFGIQFPLEPSLPMPLYLEHRANKGLRIGARGNLLIKAWLAEECAVLF